MKFAACAENEIKFVPTYTAGIFHTRSVFHITQHTSLVPHGTNFIERSTCPIKCFFHGSPSFARTNDIYGQKYRRTARLAALRIARISSCADTAFFCHRQRRRLRQLTAFGCSFKMLFQSK